MGNSHGDISGLYPSRICPHDYQEGIFLGEILAVSIKYVKFTQRLQDDPNLTQFIQKAVNNLIRRINLYDSPVAGKLFKLLTQPAPEKSEEIKVLNDFFATLKLDGDVSKADLIRNFGKLYDIGCPALVTNLVSAKDGQIKCSLASGIPFLYSYMGSMVTFQAEQDNAAKSSDGSLITIVLGELMGLDLDSPEVKAMAEEIEKIENDMYRIFFGVEPGDKLYVAPADRVKIW